MIFTNNSTALEQHASERHFVIPLLVTGGICLILNGSVLSFLIKSRRHHLQNTYQVFVLLLSFTGILVGAATSLHAVRNKHPLLEKSKNICVLQSVIFINGFLLSLVQTFLISLQRFLAVRRTTPFGNDFLCRYGYFICLALWVTVMAGTIGFLSPPDGEEMDVCLSTSVYQGHSSALKVFAGCAAFILVLTQLFYCYILRYLWAKHKLKATRSIVNPANSTITSSMQPSLHTSSVDTGIQKSEEDEKARVCGKAAKVQNTNTQNANSKVAPNLKRYVVNTDRNILEESRNMTVERGHKSSRKRIYHTYVIWKRSSATFVVHRASNPAKRKRTSQPIVLVGLLITLLSVFVGPIVLMFFFYDITICVNGIAFCISSISSTINPVICCWKMLDLPKNLKKKLCCQLLH